MFSNLNLYDVSGATPRSFGLQLADVSTTSLVVAPSLGLRWTGDQFMIGLEPRFEVLADSSVSWKVLRDGPVLAAVASGRLPRISRLLAMAHRFQGMLDRGEVSSMADIARLGRVSRARVTQVMDLRLLAPDIQEEILFLPATQSGRDATTLRQMRAVCAAVEWAEQRERWRRLGR